MWFYVAVFYLTPPATLAASIRWGGRYERRVAAMFAGAALLSIVARALDLGSLFYVSKFEPVVVFIDLSLLIGMTITAIQARTWWIICEAALLMTTMSAHILKGLGVPMSWLAYALMNGASSYPTQMLLLFGIVAHRHRARRASATFRISSREADREDLPKPRAR